jgi:8-oxo-dGTP pyrophosphatase MutT (NUDIX family)
MSEKYAVCGILPIIGDFFLSVSRKDDTDKIGFIGGKIDDGEEPEQALLREALEETGLHVTVESFVFWKQHIYTSINFFQ